MKFVVLFDDDPAASPDVRRRLMADHLAFLERHAAAIRAAGPLQPLGNEARGGLWVVDASNASEVDELVRADPFWPTGLRKSVRIFSWNQVFADGKRLLSV
jgi:uncharacterized protein